ncbi:hypothetical protein IWZ01DRAFT_545920 [Phyllosticta capitalensis]
MAGASRRREKADREALHKDKDALRKEIEVLVQSNRKLQEENKSLREKDQTNTGTITRGMAANETLKSRLAKAETKLADLVPDIREAAMAAEKAPSAPLSAQRAAKRLQAFLTHYSPITDAEIPYLHNDNDLTKERETDYPYEVLAQHHLKGELREPNRGIDSASEALRKEAKSAAAKEAEKDNENKKLKSRLTAAEDNMADWAPDLRGVILAVEDNKSAPLSAQRATKRLQSALNNDPH